ncbi:hypothetical protein VXQ47_15705 [Acinetobacter pittii]|uniref:hypothetical protein n=1 Tax=Acinetobacter pittii TaxID=48296 RepID=UPI003A839B26
MKKKQKLLFISEGETESKLIQSLFEGKCKIFNLAQNDISKIISTIPKANEVTIYLMIDTDVLSSPKQLECLVKNIEYLKKMGYSFFILQQKGDLEEELARACSCSIRDLLRYTKCSSKSELKSKFIRNPSCVLSHQSFDLKKLWSQQLIDSLQQYSDYQISADTLTQK